MDKSKSKKLPAKGLLRLSDIKEPKASELIRVSSGIWGIDRIIRGFMMGQVSIWTGINSSGKSTLLGQLLIEAVNQSFGVCAYSGELPAPVFRSWIELQMAGPKHLEKSYDEMKQDYIYYVPRDIQKNLRKWYKNKFFIHDTFGTAEAGDLLEIFEYAAENLGCRVFMIDNLMTTSLRGRVNGKSFVLA